MLDLDGTLLNTIGDITDTMGELTDRFGLRRRSEEEYALLVGKGAARLIDDIFPGNFDRKALLAEYKENLAANSFGRTRPYEGIPELLDFLAARSLPLAVFTNKPHDLSRRICRHYFGENRFTHVAGQKDDLPVKPDPSQGLEIIGAWGIEPQECLYLGDTSVDMETAENAGFLSVGCIWGFRSREELSESGAALLAEQPRDVMAHFLSGKLLTE
ncbi:MAG: HAD family hydrolase [Spirochaetales bacterium]|nr:HAD family hydrolase [Spirochaetales bacterium]